MQCNQRKLRMDNKRLDSTAVMAQSLKLPFEVLQPHTNTGQLSKHRLLARLTGEPEKRVYNKQKQKSCEKINKANLARVKLRKNCQVDQW